MGDARDTSAGVLLASFLIAAARNYPSTAQGVGRHSPVHKESAMRLRVLIAGPDELLLAAYRAFLAVEEVEIITVTNGRDCLASLQRFLPDVLNIDFELPWEPGTGIKALVNKDRGLPVVPVLFLTSRPEKVAEITAPLTSCRYMIKPVPPATVAGIVRTLAESSASS